MYIWKTRTEVYPREEGKEEPSPNRRYSTRRRNNTQWFGNLQAGRNTQKRRRCVTKWRDQNLIWRKLFFVNNWIFLLINNFFWQHKLNHCDTGSFPPNPLQEVRSHSPMLKKPTIGWRPMRQKPTQLGPLQPVSEIGSNCFPSNLTTKNENSLNAHYFSKADSCSPWRGIPKRQPIRSRRQTATPRVA